jgi:hypothetical protein
MENFRRFQTEPDPFDRVWDVEFMWLQTGISIRHADTVDVKFAVSTSGEERMEKVIALNHPDLLQLCRRMDRPLTDPWCSRLAGMHLKHVLETGEDMEKTLITVPLHKLEHYADRLKAERAA